MLHLKQQQQKQKQQQLQQPKQQQQQLCKTCWTVLQVVLKLDQSLDKNAFLFLYRNHVNFKI